MDKLSINLKRLIYLLVVVLFISCEKTEVSPEYENESWNVTYEVVCETYGTFNVAYSNENGETQRIVDNEYADNVVWGQTPWTHNMTIPKNANEAKHLFLSMLGIQSSTPTPTTPYPLFTIRIYVNDEIVAEKSGQFYIGLQITYDLK